MALSSPNPSSLVTTFPQQSRVSSVTATVSMLFSFLFVSRGFSAVSRRRMRRERKRRRNERNEWERRVKRKEKVRKERERMSWK